MPEPGAKASRARLVGDTKLRLGKLGIVANGIGALLVALFLTIAPDSLDGDELGRALRIVAPLFVVYMVVTLPLGRYLANRSSAPVWVWVVSGEPASPEIREAVLGVPRSFALNAGSFWVLAAILFGAVIATISPLEALNAGGTILLGGLTACALQYLLAERVMRPVTALALAGGAPPPSGSPGVAARLTMAWALGTGVPLFGIAGLVLADALGADVTRTKLLATTAFLVALAVVLGLVILLLAARSVGEPVGDVEHAMQRVEQGELDVSVAVDDGSEVGRLQAGFNRMASGLAERERLRDLFGRHVGRDVAAAALGEEISLGGEVRDVAALFVDLVGSTALASERPPEEVVEILNDFFAIVVSATDRNHGWVNKFEGDAALCVFGAPIEIRDAAGCALAAAREIHADLTAAAKGPGAGIGVSAGPAVAGNVGAEERFEYTVIGDPVNEAARLCDLAKERGGLLASETVIKRTSAAEAERWTLGEEMTLRGRSRPTRLASPRP